MEDFENAPIRVFFALGIVNPISRAEALVKDRSEEGHGRFGGVPGTGLSYRQTLSEGEQQPAPPTVDEPHVPSARRGWWLLAGIAVVVVVVWLGSL